MAPRSRSGCLTCRQRKLKCTEEKPTCAQCAKANRECILSSGITFRHQQNPSMNAGKAGEESLKSFYGYRETFGKGVQWVNVPQHLTFVYTNNPYEDEDGEAAAAGTNQQQQQQPQPEPVTTTSVDEEFASRLAALADNATRYHEAERSQGWDTSQTPTYPAYATHGLEALSAVASQDQYSYAPQADMSHGEQAPSHRSPTTMSPLQHAQVTPGPPHANLDFILNHGSAVLTPGDSNIDPRLHSETPTNNSTPHPPPLVQQPSPTHVRTSSYTSAFGRPRLLSKGSHVRRRPSIDSPVLAFLLRDFSERCGMWMDLFDLRLFFANVPVLAVHCPLLLYSCAAASAKCLARVDGRKPVMGGQVTPSRQSRMEFYPGLQPDAEGWVRKAREYYDLAVSLLRQALAGASRPATTLLPESAVEDGLAAALSHQLPTTDSDELVAATAILCVYEFLDASGSEWSRHLDGAKSLFDIANDRMVPLTLPPSPASDTKELTRMLSGSSSISEQHTNPSRGLSDGRRAVFWNFARQDMLSAFIDNTFTRLDTADILMWRNAGLKLTREGLVCPSNPRHPEFQAEYAMPDDLISNALIWILMKLVNFIAAGDDVPEDINPVLGVRQRELLDYWSGMDEQLRVWYEGLPDSFHATAVQPAVPHAGAGPGIEEKWFPRPMCASTMQSYHFARIQLLHNKPHVSTGSAQPLRPQALIRPSPSSSLAARHASYASILQQSRTHAKEIVAIGLGRTDEGARIHSVQPLWTAGLVLGVADEEGGNVSAETEMWRRSILTALRGIERDMGWASEYRVQSLLELWELPCDWGLEE